MSHRLQVTLDDDLYDALQAEAGRTGASLAELVRRAVADRLGVQSVSDRLAVLERTAGVWQDRKQSGIEVQAEVRRSLAGPPGPTGHEQAAGIVTGTGQRRVLVDTNVVIDVLRARPAAIGVVRERIENGDTLLLSVLTRFEVRSGALPSELGDVDEHLTLYEPVDVTTEVADRGGGLAATYRRSHRAIDAIDYLIAATTELHADELLTLNVKHFPMIPDLRPAYRTTS